MLFAFSLSASFVPAAGRGSGERRRKPRPITACDAVVEGVKEADLLAGVPDLAAS